MKINLLDAVRHHPRVCDGAMGTQLMAAGLAPGQCGERWNLTRPNDVTQIHQRYHDAGCQLITTNTFGGTRTQLARHACEDQLQKLNQNAATIAANVVGDHGWALGDIGPFGDFLEPFGEYTTAQLIDIFTQQAAALHEGGVDAFVVETMADTNELTAAVYAAHQAAPHLPVIATFAFQKSGDQFNTMMGVCVQQAVDAARAAGADIVGANCGTALDLVDYRRLADLLLHAADDTPVILQPNAGSPRQTEAGTSYDATPDDMASLAKDLVASGVAIVGGCCGTTPDHLRAIAAAVNA